MSWPASRQQIRVMGRRRSDNRSPCALLWLRLASRCAHCVRVARAARLVCREPCWRSRRSQRGRRVHKSCGKDGGKVPTLERTKATASSTKGAEKVRVTPGLGTDRLLVLQNDLFLKSTLPFRFAGRQHVPASPHSLLPLWPPPHQTHAVIHGAMLPHGIPPICRLFVPLAR